MEKIHNEEKSPSKEEGATTSTKRIVVLSSVEFKTLVVMVF